MKKPRDQIPSYVTNYLHKYVELETGEQITKKQKEYEYRIIETTKRLARDKESGKSYVEVVHWCTRRYKQMEIEFPK